MHYTHHCTIFDGKVAHGAWKKCCDGNPGHVKLGFG